MSQKPQMDCYCYRQICIFLGELADMNEQKRFRPVLLEVASQLRLNQYECIVMLHLLALSWPIPNPIKEYVFTVGRQALTTLRENIQVAQQSPEVKKWLLDAQIQKKLNRIDTQAINRSHKFRIRLSSLTPKESAINCKVRWLGSNRYRISSGIKEEQQPTDDSPLLMPPSYIPSQVTFHLPQYLHLSDNLPLDSVLIPNRHQTSQQPQQSSQSGTVFNLSLSNPLSSLHLPSRSFIRSGQE